MENEDFTLDSESSGEVNTTPDIIPGDSEGLGIVRLDSNSVLVPRMDDAATLRKEKPSGRPMVKVFLPKGVTAKDFRDVIAGAYLSYVGNAHGNIPKPEEICAYIDMPLKKVQRVMETDAFKEACKARGIAVGSNALTQQQDFALQILLDPTIPGGLEQRLKKAKISMSVYRAWLRNPTFRRHMETIGGGVLRELENDMAVALAGRAVAGDLNAIKYAWEVTGKYNPNDRQVMDGQRLMLQMIEIIKNHVKDPDTLNAIGNELVLLGNAAGLNKQVVPEIEQGENHA